MWGLTTLSEPKPSSGALVTIYTDDLELTRLRHKKAWATIVIPEFTFPGSCRFYFTDSYSYELTVWTNQLD